MQIFQSSFGKFPSTSHGEVLRLARREFHKIQKRTPRRQAYVRSKYFRKDKIFVNQFWQHLGQKRAGDQVRRLRLYNCAIDLIRNTSISPETIFSKADSNLLLHRFAGKTKDNEPFIVQVKENKRTGRKDFMSVFPSK
ncbi:hypothetical protein KDA23_06105 [Candidatus Saccharibacteria bacterium]|nr:hypothetical protein [Candidatus Saccharibacteria bacterium]